MEKDSIEEHGFANVRRSFNWSSRLLKCMGIWPLKNYLPLFLFFFIYLFLHISLTVANLIWSPKTMDIVIMSVAENMEQMMTLTKITIARINRDELRKLFIELKEYSLTEKYETKEQKLTFVNYTKLPPYFIVIIAFSMSMAELIYYLTRVAEGIQIVIAQFAILSYKVKTLLNNSKNYHEGMKNIVLRHYRLIRLSEKLEDIFNFPIMQLLLGSTIHICVSGYYLLMGPEMTDILTSLLFVFYMFSVTGTLFVYCFIGECFIQESTKFGNAIYNYEWYNLPAMDAKFFLICMIRTKKPQYLTSGKFAVLSLTVFTDIIKTSMGYLSVLRTFA
ncbi:odorant receptor 22c-like isoform X4 [Vespa velutina]|uniref:odorant receptor 22c-like isoform X4 n=1 Tax=Vespa velutina TaxID=202808 RepID=UPI001FB33C2E|nr:odorant receptor 22c-like isoform X4 [Vespa velutina]